MKRLPRVACMCLPGLLLVLAAYGQEPERYTLRYTPEIGNKYPAKLTGVLLDAAMQGQSLGINGDVSADLVSETTERDDEAQTTTVKLTLDKIKANLNGQLSAPDAPPPLQLIVDESGNIVGAKDNEEADAADAAASAFNFLDTGGVPIVMVAMLATAVRFPEQAVAVGEEWEFEDSYQVPGLGEVPINTRWQLAGMEGTKAALTSTAMAALPEFDAPNPIVSGTRMNIKGGRAYITDLKQEYDTATSQLVKSEGKLRIDAQLDFQGMTMPVSLTVSFDVKPPEATTEEAEETAEATEANP